MQFVPFEQEDRNIKDTTKIIVDQGIMRKISYPLKEAEIFLMYTYSWTMSIR